MQGQKSIVDSLPEAFEFDHASGSSSSAVDQQVYWTNVQDPGDPRNLTNYLLPPNDTNMSNTNVVSYDSGNFNGWNLAGSSSSNPTLNQISHEEAKMEHGWISSLTASAGASSRSEERRFESAVNVLSVDNVDINLNSDQIARGQLFLQNSHGAQNSEHDVGLSGDGGEVSQAGICHFHNSIGSEAEQIQSTSGFNNYCGTSTGRVGYLSEDVNGRPGLSLDSRRLSGKRKNIEGVPGQSSRSGSPSCFHQTDNALLHSVSARHNSPTGLTISSSSDGANTPEEHLTPIGSGTRGVASECLPSVSVAGNAESSRRNFRMRVNHVHQHDSSLPNLWPSGNSNRRQNYWPSYQPSSLPIPFNQSLETRAAIPSTGSQSQSHVPSIPVLPRIVPPYPWNGTTNSRIGSSSNTHVISGERAAPLREEANSRGIPRNSTSEHPIFGPALDVRHLAQDPTNWSLANGNISIPGNVASTSRVGSSSNVQQLVPPPWVPHQNLPSQYSQTLQEFIHRSIPSSSSDPGGQNNNFLVQRSGHSSSSPEMLSGAGLRVHQQPFMRSAFLMDRRNEVLSGPSSLRNLAAAREGRSRIISEHIRNALDLIRRGENIRFEDVLILDQFYGGADLHDRHRDMRLDVDNMSYEELLALEERIGNVSTGLSEETILKCLKQWKYLSMTMVSSMEVEPCSICQEEYVDGEELGRLDCGHDFHTACIKKWLMIKNLCPICKTTTLLT